VAFLSQHQSESALRRKRMFLHIRGPNHEWAITLYQKLAIIIGDNH